MDSGKPYSETSPTGFWVVIALDILLPPLAVWLERPGSRALPWDFHIWLTLVLCFLFFFPGIIYAFYVTFGKPQLKT
ncbi:hypothetical protein K439DRAFT_1640097 [Ramaria rubella]|nr:hypothetical protein K439DRAFT_1640097 [Ramaria rubella]